jgi:hypothetical protein
MMQRSMRTSIVKMILLALLLYPLPWGQWLAGINPGLLTSVGPSTVSAEVYDSSLRSLEVTGGYLYPSFSPDVLEYTMYLNNHSIEKAVLYPRPNVSTYSVNCGGVTLGPLDSCVNGNELKPGVDYSVTIRVNIPSGDAKIYRVIVKRPHNYTTTVGRQQVGGGESTGTPLMVHAGRATEYFGRDKLNVSVSLSRLEKDATGSTDDFVTIEAYGRADEETVEVNIDASAWRKASELGKKLAVHLRQGTLYIDPKALQLRSDTDQVTLLAEYEDSSSYLIPANARLASEPVRLSVLVNDQSLMLHNPFFAEFEYDPHPYYDKRLLGIYRYDDEAKTWSYQSGKALEEWKVTGELGIRGSIFAVLEMSRTFTDIEHHWAKLSIQTLAARGYTDGFVNGVMEPDRPITRAEFAGLLARSVGLQERMVDFPYHDVSRLAWYFDGISQAAKAGIVNGVTETNFAPQETITREQAATMLMRALAYAKGTTLEELIVPRSASFSDMGAISPWAVKSVAIASDSRLVEGNPDGSFDPKGLTTRAQAITILVRLMEILE